MAGTSKHRIQILQGDITRLDLDAIVNAANESLLGGGGVDGAIHRMAGPQLLEECRQLNGCPTGEARITGGYRLPARHVIHTVGPVYRTGRHGEPALLRSCYLESLRLAAQNELAAIAFPCISTGVFGYPRDEACQIALDTVLQWLSENAHPQQVTFCCFSEDDAALYREQLSKR